MFQRLLCFRDKEFTCSPLMQKGPCMLSAHAWFEALQRGSVEACAYIAWPGRRVCNYDDQERLLQHFLDAAANGSRWAENMLRMTPCDLWPFLRGRTLWLLGDSIAQARSPCFPACHGAAREAQIVQQQAEQ